jgi:cellulose synthase/poly-beta-1,6-N-acetylglucosamine synthase-like glycosyltransferase
VIDTQLATVVAAVLGGMLVPQIGLTGWFAWMVRSRMQAHGADGGSQSAQAAVPTEVVLCLRGCDATLEDVFSALACQRHPDWRLRVIVDSEQDPAWAVAHAAVPRLEERGASWREATIEPLAVRPTEGSLKCASLRQALATLDSRTHVVALLDADSVVRNDWLTTMAYETMQPGIGAVSGNRWYEPVHDSAAGTVRVIWNVGAIVQMSAFGIPWGGSLAVRREAMEASGWLDIIRTTLCEDTALAEPLRRAGWKYRFVPSLIAVDEDDDVALSPLTRWIARQLLTARLHHPAWLLVAVHGLGTSLALLMALGLAVIATASAAWETIAIAIVAIAGYEVATALLFLVITRTVRNAVASAGGRLRPFSYWRTLWQIALIPLTQAVYGVATVAALATRAIEWRGIVYDVARINGRLGVRVRTADRHEAARAAEAPTG